MKRVFAIDIERCFRCGGYRLKGRTPAQALREALDIEALPSFVSTVTEEDEKEAA